MPSPPRARLPSGALPVVSFRVPPAFQGPVITTCGCFCCRQSKGGQACSEVRLTVYNMFRKLTYVRTYQYLCMQLRNVMSLLPCFAELYTWTKNWLLEKHARLGLPLNTYTWARWYHHRHYHHHISHGLSMYNEKYLIKWTGFKRHWVAPQLQCLMQWLIQWLI